MKRAWLFLKWCFWPKGIMGSEVMEALPLNTQIPGFLKGMRDHTCTRCGKHYLSYPGKKNPQPICLRWACYRDHNLRLQGSS